MKKRKKIGLALGSGAYRGFAHIGVLRVLQKHGIQIDYMSGSSIGAWVAAYFAMFRNTDQLELDLINNRQENLSLLFDLNWSGGFIGGSKFVKYLEKRLQGYDFSDLQIPLKIVATDLATAHPYVFSKGSIATAVRASTSVPVLFKPLEYDNCLLVDGGMSDPVPCDLVRGMGADIVIGVNLYHENEFKKNKLGLSQVVVRSSVVMLHNLAKYSLVNADITVSPDLSHIGVHSSISKYFTRKVAEEMISIGEASAEAAIPELKRLLK